MYMEIKNVFRKEDFDFLYNNNALALVGIDENSFDWAAKKFGRNDTIGYLIKGKEMNEYYNLKGNVAYPDHLNILVLFPHKKIHHFIEPMDWYDEMVDRNSRAE